MLHWSTVVTTRSEAAKVDQALQAIDSHLVRHKIVLADNDELPLVGLNALTSTWRLGVRDREREADPLTNERHQHTAPGARWIDGDHLLASIDLVAAGAALSRADVAVTRPHEPMMIYFTSGTTGNPKMVRLPHGYAAWHWCTAFFTSDLKASDVHWALSDSGWAKVYAPHTHTQLTEHVLR